MQKIEAGTFMPNPQLGEAMRECFEIQQQIIENTMRECLSKSCEEFFTCLDSIKQSGPSGEGEGMKGFSTIQQEIEGKIGSCVQQFQPQEDRGFPEGSEFPESFPSESDLLSKFGDGSLPSEFGVQGRI